MERGKFCFHNTHNNGYVFRAKTTDTLARGPAAPTLARPPLPPIRHRPRALLPLRARILNIPSTARAAPTRSSLNRIIPLRRTSNRTITTRQAARDMDPRDTGPRASSLATDSPLTLIPAMRRRRASIVTARLPASPATGLLPANLAMALLLANPRTEHRRANRATVPRPINLPTDTRAVVTSSTEVTAVASPTSLRLTMEARASSLRDRMVAILTTKRVHVES